VWATVLETVITCIVVKSLTSSGWMAVMVGQVGAKRGWVVGPIWAGGRANTVEPAKMAAPGAVWWRAEARGTLQSAAEEEINRLPRYIHDAAMLPKTSPNHGGTA
jgi:hypothetical protein